MRLTYNWLKDFVEIKLEPELLADKLTMAGIEVKALEEVGGDTVFEIEITSNRPDLLSVIGIAREIAAITGKKLILPKSQSHKVTKSQAHKGFSVSIENKKDCPLYTAKIIEGVKVAPSPAWLKNRLELIGCRSINNIVDITNYILFTYGEPLHAFDLDRLSPGGIFVRRARQGERIVTIDAAERSLDKDILVIADNQKTVALAGIMGGKDSEVSPYTKNILLEAAIFSPALTRKARQKLGMQTDSSYRFERGMSPHTAQNASIAATDLILQLAGGKLTLAKSAGALKAKPKSVRVELASARRILGASITAKETKKILVNLGLNVKASGKDAFRAGIPSFRSDISYEIDIVEEIARIRGYDSMPTTLPKITPWPPSLEKRDLVGLVKQALVSLGLNEVITYSLINRALLEPFADEKDPHLVEIQNPLSSEQEVLRASLLPSLIKCVAHNHNQKQEYVNIFEVANVFTEDKGQVKEELHLAIALSGIRPLFIEETVIKDKAGLLHLKGICEALFGKLGINKYEFQDSGNGRVNISVAGENTGLLIRVASRISERFDIKNQDVVAAELSLEKAFVQSNFSRKFSSLPRFPAISRDISFILKDEIPIREVLAALEEKGKPLLAGACVTDYYKGKQIPQGCRGITVSCVYRLEERTLTEEEVNPVHSALRSLLEAHFQAKIR
ncbi:MAG: phenylalanine--tRNA ligase subunit beta [Candidatus Omnitrophota bacterium]